MSSQPSLIPIEEPLKKIAWIENAEILGGAELFSFDMLMHLAENTEGKIQIDIFTGGSHSVYAESLAKITKLFPKKISLTHQDIVLPPLQPFSLGKIGDFFSSIKNIVQKVSNGGYQIVYCNTVRSALVVGVAQLFFPKNIKTIFMAHDYTFPKFLIRWVIPRFSQVLACSYGVKQYLVENGLKAWKAEVIENGIDPSVFADVDLPQAPLFSIGIVGRISEWKGQMVVLKAAKWLLENAKEYPFEFTFYGTPSDKPEDIEYAKKLNDFVEKNTLSNVHFAGFTPMKHAMEKSKIIVHAVIEKEPFGRVPIESAASKRVVCLADIGTPAQIFEDKKTAFFFKAGDAESLAHTLVIIAHNKDKAIEIAMAGEKMVTEKFNITDISKRFWDFF